jgi:hypothetical protein
MSVVLLIPSYSIDSYEDYSFNPSLITRSSIKYFVCGIPGADEEVDI